MIGGLGEKKTLRLVARYGDACNLFAFIGIDGLRGKLDVLRRHCDDLGRAYDEIERTSLDTVNLSPGNMSVADVVAKCGQLAGVGIQHAIFNMPNAQEIKPLEVFGQEVLPEVRGL